MTSAVTPDARRVWRAARGPVAIGLVIVIVGIVIALIRGSGEGGTLDPRSADPSGSRALARLLEAEGVRIELVRTAAAADAALASGGPATLLITQPNWLVPEQLDTLAGRPAELVLIGALTLPDWPVRPAEVSFVDNRPPDCTLEAAVAAGVASMGGVRYEPARDVELCYAGSLARYGTITVLGTEAPLTNARLDEEGNAALAMRLLGRYERLVWYVPSLSDPSLRPQQRSLADLLPVGWRFGLVQLAIAIVVLALWRARRLGRVVAEPLPVVVRAAETVEGRARLYRGAGAADHAAEALRQAVRDRLVPRLGLPRDAGPHAVVAAVTERTGRSSGSVYDVLYGPPPAGDAALVRLADALDTLESEVIRP